MEINSVNKFINVTFFLLLICIMFTKSFAEQQQHPKNYNIEEQKHKFIKFFLNKDYDNAANLSMKYFKNRKTDIDNVMEKIYNKIEKNEYFNSHINLTKSRLLSSNEIKLFIYENLQKHPKRLVNVTRRYIDLIDNIERNILYTPDSKISIIYEKKNLIDKIESDLIRFGCEILEKLESLKFDKTWYNYMNPRRPDIAKRIVQKYILKNFSYDNIKNLTNTINNKFPGIELQILAYDLILEEMYKRRYTEKDIIFDFAKMLKNFVEKCLSSNISKSNHNDLFAVVLSLPECPRNIVFYPEFICIQNNNGIFAVVYEIVWLKVAVPGPHDVYTTKIKIIPGKCEEIDNQTYIWKYKNNDLIMNFDSSQSFKSVKFEIAENGGCYIKKGETYLVDSNGEPEFLETTKRPNAIWRIISFNV